MEITNIDGVAVIRAVGIVLKDVQSALGIMADAHYGASCSKIVIFKENIAKEFFKLSTGLLGEVLQKFVNYGMILAIVGDFSKYTSKPLSDFIYESNKGKHIFFVPDEQTAIEKLI